MLFSDVTACEVLNCLQNYEQDACQYYDEILKWADTDKKIGLIRAMVKSNKKYVADYLEDIIDRPSSDLIVNEAKKTLARKKLK